MAKTAKHRKGDRAHPLVRGGTVAVLVDPGRKETFTVDPEGVPGARSITLAFESAADARRYKTRHGLPSGYRVELFETWVLDKAAEAMRLKVGEYVGWELIPHQRLEHTPRILADVVCPITGEILGRVPWGEYTGTLWWAALVLHMIDTGEIPPAELEVLR